MEPSGVTIDGFVEDRGGGFTLSSTSVILSDGHDGSKSEAWGRGARTLSSFFGTAALGSYLGRVATKHLSAEQINAASKVTIGVGTAIINE